MDLGMELTLLVPSHFTLKILCENTKSVLYSSFLGIYEKLVPGLRRRKKRVFHFLTASIALSPEKLTLEHCSPAF